MRDDTVMVEQVVGVVEGKEEEGRKRRVEDGGGGAGPKLPKEADELEGEKGDEKKSASTVGLEQGFS